MDKLKELLFENRGVNQRIIKNTFWLGFGQVAGRLIRSVVLILAARIIGAEGYGVFSYVISIAGIMTIFSDIGLSKLLVRDIAKNPEEEEKYISTALGIKFFFVVLSIVLIISGAPLITNIPEALPLIPIAALLLVFDGFRIFLLAITRAKEKMQVEAGIEVFTNMAIVFFGAIVLVFFPSPKLLMTGYTLGVCLGLVFAWWLIKDYLKKLRESFSKELVKKILSDAWPFALISFFSILMIHTDTIMIGILRAAEDVGLYAAAQRPVQILYIFPSLLGISFLPALSRFAGKEEGRLRLALERVLAGVFLLALPIALGGLIVGPEIIQFVYGNEFAASAIPFKILLLSLIAVFPGSIMSFVILAYNEQKSIIKFWSGVALANIFLNYLLIPYFGIIGAASATIVTLFAANGFAWLRVQKINSFRIFPLLWKITISVVIMTLFTMALKSSGIHFLINITLSATLYIIILYLLKEKTLFDLFQVVFGKK